ncbi:DUF3168 domain-containing protein [Zavarzinella formosa]|uniref:DUF3168 domain-containing protein n=1 Tax=Zavarzinella formosa TaxID=360055 RepID=UPI0003012736|nr:DUF3168 domain-containing protein [Zavarzinella formosa]
MSSPDNALQKGVYDRLVGYSPLTTALGGPKVYDHVPQGTDAPYVVIGDDTALDWDTKDKAGWEFTLTVHCWDFAASGRKSVKALLGFIYDALHQQEDTITVAGFALVQIRREFQTSFQETAVEGDSDSYYHGVARYRAVVQDI